MARTYDGRRFLQGAGLTVVAVLLALLGGAWWFVATFTFSVEGPTHGQRVDAALGLAGAAGTAVAVAALARWRLRVPAWSVATTGLVALVLLAAAAYQLGL